MPSILLDSKTINTNFHGGMRIDPYNALSKPYDRDTKHNGNISRHSDHVSEETSIVRPAGMKHEAKNYK